METDIIVKIAVAVCVVCATVVVWFASRGMK